MVQNIVRLDKGEEEESEVTQEVQRAMEGGGKEEEATMEKAGERGGQKRKGDAPQGSRVTTKKRVYKKPVEADPSAGEKSPSAEEGERRRVEKSPPDCFGFNTFPS